MEESGVPKKNIVLAVVLAFGVYALWYSMLPKPKPVEPAPAVAIQKTAEPETKPMVQAAQEASAAVIPLELEFFSGSLKADGGSWTVLSGRKAHNGIGEEILAEGSEFLSTRSLTKPGTPWSLKSSRGDTAVLEMEVPGGSLKKEFKFKDADGFGLLRLALDSRARAAESLELSMTGIFPMSDARSGVVFAGYVGKKDLIIQQPKKKQETMEFQLAPGKPLSALGLSNRYHMALVYGLEKISSANSVFHPAKSQEWRLRLKLEPGQSVEIPFYAGLKKDATIEKLGVKNLLYGGMLGPLKRLIQSLLSWLYGVTGNYGVSIILLTLIFQIVLLPLTWKNVKLSLKMKQVMPKVKLVQEKYKSDPAKMNAEMMALYRKEGANPLGGCLLLLPQMPIFIALYSSLNENYALFGAPFMFWIQNLAAHDPTYILPIVMGGAMLLQTKLNAASTPADPSQKMLTYMMPAMFTVMFLKFPSGLVLYWLTSNVLSIGITTVLPKFIEKST